MNVGSLFSGIGGLDLGLERAGMQVRWQCEIDPYCRAVLAHHWPGLPVYEDIRDIDGTAERVDLICGGFPCQPVSLAGKGLAQEDPRWLWPEFARVVGDLRPKFVLIENVPGLVTAGKRQRDRCLCGWPLGWGGLHHGFGEGRSLVLSEGRLRNVDQGGERTGMDAEQLRRVYAPLAGSDGEMVGLDSLDIAWRGGSGVLAEGRTSSPPKAPAGRTCDSGERTLPRRLERSYSVRGAWDQAADSGLEQEGADECPSCGRSLDRQPQPAGFAAREVLQGLSALGYDAEWEIVSAAACGAPHLRERIFVVAHARGEQHEGDRPADERQTAQGLHEDDPHASGDGREGQSQPDGQPQPGREAGEQRNDADGLRDHLADANSAPRNGAWSSSEAVFRPEAFQRLGRCGSGFGDYWAVEPDVGRVAHGVPNRLAQLRSLGNAVVPQVAEAVGRMILEAA